MDSWLDLVRQYGDARCLVGIGRDYAANTEEAQALFARIAALVPQQPVQARSGIGFPWFHHGCGEVAKGSVPPRLHTCDKPGPWRPLLVAAPDGDRTPEAKASPFGVRGWVHVDGTPCPEYLAPSHYKTLWCTTHGMNVSLPEPDLIAAPDGDRTPERPGQTPSKGEIHVVAVLDESGNPRLVVQWPPDSADPRDTYQQKLIDERDEACAEVERLRTKVNDVRADRDRILAFGEHLMDQLRAEIERLKAAQSDPLVLRRPEVPEGTVALVGVDGDRYRWLGDGSDQWEAIEPRPGWRGQLGALLDREGTPVRVELAPPREQRTAAEIWRDIRQPSVVLSVPIELAEALDREAGL
jgi:hypothetical protein